MKQLPLLILFSGLISFYSKAQVLTGMVRDSADNAPLNRAAIVIDFEKHTKGTYTNAEGKFSLYLSPGSHILVVRHVGYLPYRINIRGGQNLDLSIKLLSVSSQLEEVVVTDKGYDRTVREPLLGVSRINMKTIERIPAALGEIDILRSLQLLPGVTSVGEAANGINIRGGNTDQSLILMDETPIFNPTHMFGLFSVFPADAVRGLDLYKGNVPARFGGRAGSVLDISLRNPGLDKFSMKGGVSIVSNKLTLDIPIVKDKLGLMISGRGSFNSSLLPLVSKKLDSIKANFGDVVGKLFWRMNRNNTMTAMGYFSKDLFSTKLIGGLADINSVSTQYRHETMNGLLQWFSTISPKLNLQTTAVLAQYTPDILTIESGTNSEVTLRQQIQQKQIKSNLNYQGANSKTEIGINAIHYQLNPGELLPGGSPNINYRKTPNENSLEMAIHADYEASLSEKLVVSAGLRYSYFMSLGPGLVRKYAPGEAMYEASVIDSVKYGNWEVSKTYGGLEPRLGIRYATGPNTSFKIGYNLMRQYLQVITNTTTPLPTARWKTSDPNIKPQLSQLFSVGWFQNLKDNTFEFSTEAYWRTTQNTLDYKPGADFLLQPYPETQLLPARAKAYGVELMLSKKKGELTGWLNYTYARSFNQVTGNVDVKQQINNGDWYRANYDRPHSLNLSINLNQGKTHSFSFNFVYSTGRPFSAPNGQVFYMGRVYPVYNERNQGRLPDYHRLDFAWNIYNPSMKKRRWQGRWAFTVYNLYGRKNAYSIYFKQSELYPYRLAIFATPIPSLSYNFEFK
ncbi:TonB-dependent receptor [Emticicia fontis]